MNINLSAASSKKKGKNSKLSYGLNSKTQKSKANVFDNDSDSGEDKTRIQSDNKSARDAVNAEIAAEQAALRRRAQQAIENADTGLYEYDEAYETFKSKDDAGEEPEGQEPPEGRKSRYIQSLLKQSKKREVEREAILERKIAREQAEEDAQMEYQGKEKFVTKAYKRKLEERKRLEEEDKKQQEEDEREDVTKKTGDTAFASFYGNFNRNVAMGGSKRMEEDRKGIYTKERTGIINSKQKEATNPGFMEGFEGGGNEGDDDEKNEHDKAQESLLTQLDEQAIMDPASKRRNMMKARKEKLAQARTRFFERNGTPVQGVS